MAQKKWSITLYPKYINFMRTGKKTVEGRCNTGMFKKINVGDSISFFSKKDSNNEITMEVVEKREYISFKELIEAEGVQAMLPDLNQGEADVALKIYRQIPGYVLKEKKFGVVALQLKKI